MVRPLNVRDRVPRQGDVLRYGRTRIEVRAEPVPPYCPYLVCDERGLTRLSLWAMRGMPTDDAAWWCVQVKGHDYWTEDGRSLSPIQPPYIYISRADGGVLDVPIDCTA